jgi:two-component system, OmpR family, heavy metal sensor histidine kinase CusS
VSHPASYSIGGRLARRVGLMATLGLAVVVALTYATTAMLMQNKQANERAQKIEVIALVAREAAAEGGFASVPSVLAAMALRRPGTQLQVRHADGRVFYADPDAAPFRVADGEVREPFTLDLSPLGGEVLSATLAIDCLHDTQMMRSLAWFLFFVPLVGGGLLGAGTAWRVRCELRPLRHLAAQTQRISADRLGERLALPEPAAVELQPWIAQFNALMDRLQAAIEQLDAFNADVAHELRTPLAAVMGHVEVALSRERPAGELRETMALSLEQMQQLSALVDDMLFLSHADSGAQARRHAPKSLRPLAEKVIEYHAFAYEDAGIAARVEGDALAAVDDALVERALSNLLGNALRYAQAGSTVVVSLSEQAGADSASLLVGNQGPTIEPELLPRLFDRFFRADRARTGCQQHHHGLGLAIVAAVARMHGGHTLAQSQDGQTRIGFTLRREQVPPTAGPARPRDVASKPRQPQHASGQPA